MKLLQNNPECEREDEDIKHNKRHKMGDDNR